MSAPPRVLALRLAGHSFELETADTDAHLDRLIAAEGDERLIPYWTEVWPSAAALGEWLLERRAAIAGRATLDLGCGLGLAGIAAAAAGASPVYLADLHRDAVELAHRNAARCGVAAACRPLPLDWRSDAPPAPLDLLIAADILFERAEHANLERFLADRLPPTLPVILADPLRKPSREFLTRPETARLLHPFGQRRVLLGDGEHTIHFFANEAGLSAFAAPAPPADAPPPPSPPPSPPRAASDRVSP